MLTNLTTRGPLILFKILHCRSCSSVSCFYATHKTESQVTITMRFISLLLPVYNVRHDSLVIRPFLNITFVFFIFTFPTSL
jgi:hypothetical protein